MLKKIFGSGKGKVELNEREAFVAISLCIIAADGVIEDEEAFAISAGLVKMKMFRGHDLEVMRVFSLVLEHGIDQTIKAAKSTLPPQLRETAFAFAVDLALSDGHLAESEMSYLNKLSKGLGIHDKLVKKIIEVMQIKNRA